MDQPSKLEDHKVAVDALIRKRTEIAGQIRELEHKSDQLRAELIHVDSVLRLFDPDIEADNIPAKPRAPLRSAYFARGELTRICLGGLRGAAETGDGWLTGEKITVATMQDKRLDPVRDRRLRADFHRRILQTLDAGAAARNRREIGAWPQRRQVEDRRLETAIRNHPLISTCQKAVRGANGNPIRSIGVVEIPRPYASSIIR